MLDEHKCYLFGQIQTSQTEGQLFSDTFPYGKVSMGFTDNVPTWSQEKQR